MVHSDHAPIVSASGVFSPLVLSALQLQGVTSKASMITQVSLEAAFLVPTAVMVKV